MSGINRRSRRAASRQGAAERLHRTAYGYYAAAHAVSGDAPAAARVRRLASAALLSSASALVLGSMPTSAQAAGPCNTAGLPTITCSGQDNSSTGITYNGNNINLTNDGIFVTQTQVAATPGDNTVIAITGDSGTVTNTGILAAGEFPNGMGVRQYQHHGIHVRTTTSARAYSNGGVVTVTDNDSVAILADASGGEYGPTGNAIAVNGADSRARVLSGAYGGAVLAVTDAGAGSATATNSGQIEITGDAPGGMRKGNTYNGGVAASGFTANATNAAGATITDTGNGGTIGIYASTAGQNIFTGGLRLRRGSAAGSTATATNAGTVSVTGSSGPGGSIGVLALDAANGTATAANSGSVTVSGTRSLGLSAQGGTTHTTNTGTVNVTGNYSTALSGSSQLVRTTNITNSGTAAATGTYSVGIRGTGPTVNITNEATGVVSGDGAGIVFMPTNYYDGMTIVGGTATVINRGTVNGDVTSTQPGGMMIGGLAARNSASITNTGTINGAIVGDNWMGTGIQLNGGTVGNGAFATRTGTWRDVVTVSGTGNVIRGTLFDPGGQNDVLSFNHTDTLTLSTGNEGYGIQGFDVVNFNSGVTDFNGVNAFLGPGETPGMATINAGATLRSSGANTAFRAATVTARGLGTQRGTIQVPAGGRINFSGDVTFENLGRFRVGIAGQNNAGYMQAANITFNAGSEIYADLTRGIQLTDGTGIQVAVAQRQDDGPPTPGTITDNGLAVFDNSALVNFTHEIRNGNQLFLIPKRGVRAVPATDANQGSSNARGIAAAIDAFIDSAPTDNPIVQYLAQFPVEEQQQRLAQLVQDSLPDEAGATGSASVASTDMVIDLIMTRLSGGGFAVVDNATGGGQTGVAAGELFLGTDANLAFWGRAGGSFAEFTPSGVSGFDSNTYAVSVGLDGDVTPLLRVGGAFFYSTSDVDETGPAANSGQQIEGMGLLAYASWRPDDWYVNLTAGLGLNDYKSQRLAAGTVHTANYGGEQMMGRIEAGRIFTFGDGVWDVTPHAGLNVNQVWIDGYTETGPVATTISSQDITSVRAVAGVAARYTMEFENGSRFLPEGYVRGLQELADPSQPITGSVVGGGTFVSSPTERDDFSVGIGGGFTYEFTDIFSARLLYDGEFQDDYREDSITAAIRIEF